MEVTDYFSPSSLDSFYDCRQQWAWSRPGGYRSSRISFSLELGTGVHEALAEYYRARMEGRKRDPVKAFVKWWEVRMDTINDYESEQIMTNIRAYGTAMLAGYVEEYGGEPFEVLAVEETIRRRVPGTDWDILVRVDAIVRNWYKKVYVLEHKTFTSWYEDHLARNHQFTLEAWAARGIQPVEGVLYNGIRKHIPGPRTILPTARTHPFGNWDVTGND